MPPFRQLLKIVSEASETMLNTFIFQSDSSFSLSLPPISDNGESATGTIDWGDGTVESYDSQAQWDSSSTIPHTYATGGTYTVTIETTKFTTTTSGFMAGNSCLVSVILAEGITTIKSGTFANATSLEKIAIPSTAVLQGGAFYNCTALTDVTIGNKFSAVALENHNTAAFNGCTSLKDITYYTDDKTLVGTTNNEYFVINDTSFTTINFLAVESKTTDIISFTDYPIRTIEVEEFETKKINRIKVIESGGAVLYNIGEGNAEPNYYNIKGNFLLTGRTADDETLKETVNALYTKMSALYYTPCTITAKGLPYLETGDLLEITKDSQTIRTYILSRTLKGTIALTDSFEANGVNTLREVYSAEDSISQTVYNNYQSNRLNYITSQNGEKIILPTERTNAISQTFGSTDDLSNFEYMGLVTATISQGGTLKFEYRVDGETLESKVLQTAQSPSSVMALFDSSDSDLTLGAVYQQVVLYLPQTNSAIGTHSFEVDVISDATGYIDKNHWVSCWRGQNLTTTDKAVISIIIIDLPNKLVYAVNEALNTTGLVVGANYLGGARKILTQDQYTISYDTSTVGTQQVLITYKNNNNLTATFNIEVTDAEYLKINEYYAGQKFLESYSKQQVSTGVYWVHEVDGEMVETYISPSNFNTWECSTLEPYSSTSYVSYYIIPAHDKFGEHDMKITYKSPESGNILTIEYPIYYLEEKSFDLGMTLYDWYPFRTPFGYANLGYGTLLFECTANDGEKITFSYDISINIGNIRFDFPEVADAQFRLGEGQIFGTEYISSYTHRKYSDSLIVNIRHYCDERNPLGSIGTGATGEIEYYYKDIRPMAITFEFDDSMEYVDTNVRMEQYYAMPYNDTYYHQVVVSGNVTPMIEQECVSLSSSQTTDGVAHNAFVFCTSTGREIVGYGDTSNTSPLNKYSFYFPDSINEINVPKVTNSNWRVALCGNSSGYSFLTGVSSMLSPNTTAMASCGYVYWGDGLIDFISICDTFYSSALTGYLEYNGSSSVTTVSRNNFSKLYLRNGNTLITSNYSEDGYTKSAIFDTPLFGNTIHTYSGSGKGTFKVELPHFFGYKVTSDGEYFMHDDVTSDRFIGERVTGSYYTNIRTSEEEDEILEKIKAGSGGSLVVHSSYSTNYDTLQIDDTSGAKNIIEIDYGQACYFGVAGKYSAPILVKFLPPRLFSTSGLGHLKKITIPKIDLRDGETAKQVIPTSYWVDECIYEGSIDDFKNSDLGSYIGGGWMMSLDLVTGDSTNYSFTIQCNDGTITL